MFLKTLLTGLLLVGALTACTPNGYIDSHAMRTAASQTFPSSTDIDEVAACHTKSVPSQDAMAVTVLFSNADRAHYLVTQDTIQRDWMVSAAQEDATSPDSRDYGCFNDSVNRGSIHVPDYWLTMRGGLVRHGYIDESIVHNRPFQAEERRKLQRVADAVKVALSDHAKFVPSEQSWK